MRGRPLSVSVGTMLKSLSVDRDDKDALTERLAMFGFEISDVYKNYETSIYESDIY
jgi:hypothetical protein